MNTNPEPAPDTSNLPPVGDIKLSKVKGSYNTYKLEMSMGQIEAMRNALEKDHADPISDELLAILTYYIDKVPGPGEEEEDIKAREEGGAAGAAAAVGAEGDEEGDFPIPMPPTEGGSAEETPPPRPPGAEEEPGGEELPSSEAPMPEAEPDAEEPANQRLPAPPRE